MLEAVGMDVTVGDSERVGEPDGGLELGAPVVVGATLGHGVPKLFPALMLHPE